jgi:hypothetical protein
MTPQRMIVEDWREGTIFLVRTDEAVVRPTRLPLSYFVLRMISKKQSRAIAEFRISVLSI